jgi:predicted  nucleic acid-binding Zn-ribbon protein
MQLTDAQDKIASLEGNLQALSSQLELAKRNEKQLSDTLASTREALQLFQVTAHQKVEHKDQELSQLQCEISILEQQRQALERQVEESREETERLETAHGRAREDVGRLEEQCGELRNNHETCVGEREAELRQVRPMVIIDINYYLCDDLYPISFTA